MLCVNVSSTFSKSIKINLAGNKAGFQIIPKQNKCLNNRLLISFSRDADEESINRARRGGTIEKPRIPGDTALLPGAQGNQSAGTEFGRTGTERATWKPLEQRLKDQPGMT